MNYQLPVLKNAIQKWWFIPLVFLPQFIPPYTTAGYTLLEWGSVNAYILTHPIKTHLVAWYPLFQLLPLVVLMALVLFKNRTARFVSIFVGISYISMGFLQGVAVNSPYGTAFCLAHILTSMVLAGFWFREAAHPQNWFTFRPAAVRSQFWSVTLALLAFWEPVNRVTLQPDFNPVYLLTSGTGAVFCFITPLYLTLLLLQFPHVNLPLLGATSSISVFLALGNFFICFVMNPAYGWIGILHIPLLVIGLYGLRQTWAAQSV